MKEFKVKHSKTQIAGIVFSFILTLSILSLIFICISIDLIILFASFIFLYLLFCIDYVVYNISVENEKLTVKHLFFRKAYDLNAIEYIETSHLSTRNSRMINPNINKNKSSYIIHFKNGKVGFNDNMKNSKELVKTLSKYCIFDRILS